MFTRTQPLLNHRTFPKDRLFRDENDRVYSYVGRTRGRTFEFNYKLLHGTSDLRRTARVSLRKNYVSTPMRFTVCDTARTLPGVFRREDMTVPLFTPVGGDSKTVGSRNVGVCTLRMTNARDSEAEYERRLREWDAGQDVDVAIEEEEEEEEFATPTEEPLLITRSGSPILSRERERSEPSIGNDDPFAKIAVTPPAPVGEPKRKRMRDE